MLKKTCLLAAASALIIGLSGCSSATDDKSAKNDIPSSATSRADIEKIIHAYIMDNPEVILQSVDNLAKQQQQAAVKAAAKALENNPKDFSIGPKDAPVTIVEYFDYNCGVCKHSVAWVQDQIKNSDGNVRFVFKEFPIFGEQSENAAHASLAAMKQGKYFEFHQELMKQKAHALTQEKIDEVAIKVGLDLEKLHKDMKSDEIQSHLDESRREGMSFSVEATPYFFVNGKLIPGFDTNLLQNTIEEALKEKKKG